MSDPRELMLLTQAERMLAEATTIDQVKHIRNTAINYFRRRRDACVAPTQGRFVLTSIERGARYEAHTRWLPRGGSTR
jgi:hypothetical protein